MKQILKIKRPARAGVQGLENETCGHIIRKEQNMEIYKDEKRTLTVEKGVLRISSNAAITIYLSDASIGCAIPADYKTALAKKGEKPENYYVLLGYGGKTVNACLPIITRDAVGKAIKEHKASVEAMRNRPSAIARAKVSGLYNRAAGLVGDAGEYYPALNRAQAAKAQWEKDYPEDAKKERKENLLVEAESLKSKAIGALVYDADGSLTAADQQKNHDEWMAKANTKIEEANRP